MSINYNPKIVTDGLVLCLDAANAKSFDANENLLTYSEQFEDGAWFKVRASVASNVALAPNGTLTADKLVEDTTANNNHRLARGISITANSVCTLSFYAKAGERTWVMAYLYATGGMAAFFDLSNGVVGNTSGAVTTAISSEGNGWYRCSISGQVSGSTADIWILTSLANNQTYTGDGTSGIYLWGAQFEIASTASRYYATVATAKNRGTSLTDISGNGIVGTLTNGPTYNALNNGSIVFDGVDDYILGTSNLGIFGDPNFSICYWAFWDDSVFSNNYPSGVGNNSTGVTNQGLSTTWLNGRIALDFWNNRFRATTALEVRKWYYVCFTKSSGLIGSTCKLYVNAQEYSGSVEGVNTTPNITNSPLIIGRLDATRWFKGIIPCVQIYNRVLSSAEIQQNFNALRGRFET